MADLNVIRAQLLELIHPPPAGEETVDVGTLFEEWTTWTTDEEVETVSATLAETQEPRLLRLLLQYLSTVQTPGALTQMERLLHASDPAICQEALERLEKIKSKESQLFLMQIADREPDLRPKVLQALERCATVEIVKDLRIWLERAREPAIQVTALAIFKTIRAFPMVPVILQRLRRTQEPSVIAQALFSLAHLGRKKHRRHFFSFLQSPSGHVRRAALFGLSRVGGTKGLLRMLDHLPHEPDPSLQRDLLIFLSRAEAPPHQAAFDKLARWAAHAESPSQRAAAMATLYRWIRRGYRRLGQRALRRCLSQDPHAAAVLLHGLASVGALQEEFLWETARSHPQTLVRATALEALIPLTLPSPSEGRGEGEGEASGFLTHSDASLRYTAALLLGTRTTQVVPMPLRGEGPDAEGDGSPAFQGFLYKQWTQKSKIPENFWPRVVEATRSSHRSTRLLAAQWIGEARDLRGVGVCQEIVLRDSDERIVQEALRAILGYAALPHSKVEDALQDLIGLPRLIGQLRTLLSDPTDFPPRQRKALAIHLFCFLALHPLLQSRPLNRRTLEWLVVCRLLARDLERDLVLWLQLGVIPLEGFVPALTTLHSLLRRRPILLDFDWIALLLGHSDRWIREHAARLLKYYELWTPAQTSQLTQWYVQEPEADIRKILHEVLRERAIRVSGDRRKVAG